MAFIGTPSGYGDRYFPPVDHNVGESKEILFKPGVPLQAAELNELQMMKVDQYSRLALNLFTDGQFLSGGALSTSAGDPSGIQINFAAGEMYALGYVHDVPAGNATITGIGNETVSLVISDTILTALPDVPGTIQDLNILDVAVGAEAYGQAGADRLIFAYTYVANSTTGILIASFINGQLVTKNNGSSLWDQILALLAERTYEQSGSFLATQPVLTPVDIATPDSNPVQMQLAVTGGIGYVEGYRFVNVAANLPLLRPIAGAPRIAEPDTFLTSTLVYTLDDPPALAINTVLETVQSGNIDMIRGSIVNGQDGIPSEYQPVVSIVSAIQGDTTYVQGTDYAQTGNYITWLPDGSQPATGSSYVLVVQYTRDGTKAIRTYTSVTNESHTATAPTYTNTLSHIDVATLVSVVNHTTSTTLVEGTDFTFVPYSGVITWITTQTGDTIYVTYAYWAHTTEGDFVGRDSFQDSAGNVLYYQSPTKTPTGIAVDFTSQISFDTTSGTRPVNDSTVYISYTYALPRTDVLAWHTDGLLYILEGIPSLSPSPVVPDATYMPIAQLIMPAEAFAADVTIQLYNNLTMKVTDLRTLQNQVFNLQYDIAEFQLEQSALNQPTVTDKIGIFADNFSTPLLADINNEAFAVTWDFLANTVQLPRTGDSASPTPTSLSGVTLYQDTYYNNFTEVPTIVQPYKTTPIAVNQLGAVNQKATIVLTPGCAIEGDNNLTVYTQQVNEETSQNTTLLGWQDLNNAMLMINTSPDSPIATTLGTASGQAANPLLNNVPVEQYAGSQAEASSYFFGGPPPANSTVVVSDQWATVLATQSVVVEGTIPDDVVITVAGSNFRPDDRDIILLFDGTILPLTGIDGTAQDGTYSTAVVANSSGEFTATFTVPANTSSGTHIVQVISRLSDELTTISSIATANFVDGAYVEYLSLYVSLQGPPTNLPCQYIPAFVCSEVMGVGVPNNTVTNSMAGPAAYTFAYLIAQAVSQSLEVSNDLMATAIQVAFQYTNFGHAAISAAAAEAMADACNLASTNVAANAAAMLAASPFASLSLGSNAVCSLDPLGQTFTPSQDGFISSIDLYFASAPNADNPVSIAIADVSAGQPLNQYYATATVAGSSIGTTGNTRFEFPKPIYVYAGTEYAFVVQTQDTTAAVWSAELGQTDTNLGLVTNNPFAGALLNSADGQSWQLLAGQDLTFNINFCSFSETQGVISYGLTEFEQDSSRMAFYAPYACPSADTTVQYQYSVNGTEWIDFAPTLEVDFGEAISGVYVQVLLNGTQTLCPTVFNASQMLYYIWNSSGEYIHREFTLPTSSEAQYIEFYVDCYIPGNTTLEFDFSPDGGTTWYEATHVSGNDVPINNLFTTKNYQYDADSADITTVVTRCLMTTTSNYVSPAIQNYRVIAR